jgi:hypothetical protein
MIWRVGERPPPGAVLLLVVLACVAVAPVAAAGAGALEGQAGAPNGSNATTATGGTASNATGNASNASNESGAGGGGVGIGMPDPGEAFAGMLERFINMLLDGGSDAYEAVAGAVFRLPAPGEAGDPSTWNTPDGGVWGAIDGAMRFPQALAVVLLVFAVATAGLEPDEYARRQRAKRCWLGLGALILGLIAPGVFLHTGNAIIEAVRPSGSEFFSTADGLGNLAVGIGVGLILGLVQSSVFGVGLIVLAVERWLIYVTVYLFPAACACYAFRGFVRSLGQTILFTFGVVVFLKITQALFLRLLFELPVAGDGALMSLVLQVAGLAFVLIYWPKTMLDHANDAASMSLGVSAAVREGGKAFDRGSNRAAAVVRDRYDSYRGDGDGAPTGPTVGQVGTTNSQSGGATTTSGSPGGSVGATGGAPHRTDGDAPRSTGDGVGIDADEWDRHRERFDTSNRGFQ